LLHTVISDGPRDTYASKFSNSFYPRGDVEGVTEDGYGQIYPRTRELTEEEQAEL
jgi:hypothetical protein